MTRIGSIAKAVFAVLLLAALAVGGIGTHAGETPTKLRIIYTDDMMGYWQPCG